MNKFRIVIALSISCFIYSCGSTKDNGYNKAVSSLILSNPDIKSKLVAIFELNEKGAKIFKVIISRRDEFIRITIHEMINKEELDDSPSSYFTFNSNTFLCFDGSEIILNKKLDKAFMDKLKGPLGSRILNDSHVFQFDIDNKKNIKFHIPAINPYDLIEGPPKKLKWSKNA